MKTNLVQLGKLALAVAAITLACAAQTINAATIKMEVKVPGISSWVLVKAGAWPQYGGRVVWDSNLGCYVTDDVARGETMRIIAIPITGESIGYNASWFGIWCEAQGQYIYGLSVTLPYVNPSYLVPTNTALDNLYIDVYSNLGLFSKRMPIGPRVR